MRERLAGEIVPIKAEQSSTKHDNEVVYGADRAIDLDLTTYPTTQADSGGASWFMLTFDKEFCIDQVVWSHYNLNSQQVEIRATWTCSQTDCLACEGVKCSDHSLTVEFVGEAPASLPSDCKYGDKVKVKSDSGGEFSITEIAVTEKQGEIIFLMEKE